MIVRFFVSATYTVPIRFGNYLYLIYRYLPVIWCSQCVCADYTYSMQNISEEISDEIMRIFFCALSVLQNL